MMLLFTWLAAAPRRGNNAPEETSDMPLRSSTLLSLVLPCMVVCVSPAIAQEAQSTPNVPAVRLDKVSVRPDWVRYENTASNRPSVIVYATIQNRMSSPILLMPSMFEASLLEGGHVYGASSYTFAVGTAAGQEGSFTAARTLAPNHFVTLAFRYQLQGRVSALPSTWAIKERQLPALLGKTSPEIRFSVPAYQPPLKTPPLPPLRNQGLQTLRPPSSFLQLGPVRLRADQISYGVSSVLDKWGPVLASVDVTVQNMTNAAIEIDSGYFDAHVVDEADKRTRYAFSKFIQGAGSVYGKVRLNSGESIPAQINFNMQGDAGLRSVRRLDIRYTDPQRTTAFSSVDLPRFTASAASPAAGKTAAPTPGVTPEASGATAAAGDFKKTAYMDVKLDRAGRSKLGGAEVTLTLRNMIGRRLGMQNDWQTYSLLGSDGVEYRADGNHYGASGSEPLASTVWLENENEAKRTWVFLKVPSKVTPVRLIIREGAKEQASIDLPR
jgi:hypothetical protein